MHNPQFGCISHDTPSAPRAPKPSTSTTRCSRRDRRDRERVRVCVFGLIIKIYSRTHKYQCEHERARLLYIHFFRGGETRQILSQHRTRFVPFRLLVGVQSESQSDRGWGFATSTSGTPWSIRLRSICMCVLFGTHARNARTPKERAHRQLIIYLYVSVCVCVNASRQCEPIIMRCRVAVGDLCCYSNVIELSVFALG